MYVLYTVLFVRANYEVDALLNFEMAMKLCLHHNSAIGLCAKCLFTDVYSF